MAVTRVEVVSGELFGGADAIGKGLSVVLYECVPDDERSYLRAVLCVGDCEVTLTMDEVATLSKFLGALTR